MPKSVKEKHGRSKVAEVTAPKVTSTRVTGTATEIIHFRKQEVSSRGIFILLKEEKRCRENKISRSSFRRWFREQYWQHCRAAAPSSSREHSR